MQNMLFKSYGTFAKKDTFIHLYMPHFFFITGLKTGQNMAKHKMIFKMSK